MQHVEELLKTTSLVPESFLVTATGRFYTPESLGKNLVNTILDTIEASVRSRETISIIDPFGGDGRLITWLIDEWTNRKFPNVSWNIELWDINGDDLADFEKINRERLPHSTISVTTKIGDSFVIAKECLDKFDIVITNPPWEMLKPDSRELKHLDKDVSVEYIKNMRKYDEYITKEYPLSQPQTKFAGWGTNLSRVGLEVSLGLLKKDSILGIVMPASVLADQQSMMLRESAMIEHTLEDVAYYPAEAKLFEGADTSASTIVIRNSKPRHVAPKLHLYDKNLELVQSDKSTIDRRFLELNDYVLPVTMGVYAIDSLILLQQRFESFSKLENADAKSLWVGRELDETGVSSKFVADSTLPLFIKGRMINRFETVEQPSNHIELSKYPKSIDTPKIVWRDVSRASQKRRMIATVIPKGFIAGNSLGVAHFKDNSEDALTALLGIMSSIVFEFQLRCHLANGHVSLSALRKVYLPPRSEFEKNNNLISIVNQLIASPSDESITAKFEAVTAKLVYGLSKAEFTKILRVFPTLTQADVDLILNEFDKLPSSSKKNKIINPAVKAVIPNHLSATLSELDLRMVYSIPAGGNWKDIPLDIPSKRLDQIRESFKLGLGSRSTYYGRLHPDKPSYTITTYFNRPGNGCHVHYAQNRVISQREAARLQSFPDDFVFIGSQGSVNTQIGNAVPPLLAYQIAKTLGTKGAFIDLFSGAGGLGLGFKWAGWKPVFANDIDRNFLATYSENVHNSVIEGSIADPSIMEILVKRALEAKELNKGKPFWVLGGPPCQGFSTAGKRGKDDMRNQLFWSYKEFLEKVRPDGFVFENVTGLLNMDGGAVFEQVKDAFKSVMPNMDGWVLNIDDYAIPQRRKRVVLVGTTDTNFEITKPEPITRLNSEPTLFNNLPVVTSVKEALNDLPSILPGQDGSHLNYQTDPDTDYQLLMRGNITPAEYLERVVGSN